MPENENIKYYGQDASALGKIVDIIIPMQYKGNYNAGASWLANTTQNLSSKANIWSGLQSYRSDDDPTILSNTELSNDIDTCLTNGASGAILFRYGLSPNIQFPSQPTPPSGKKHTWMEGTDVNMNYQDGTRYQCAVYDDGGRVAGTVNLTVNGKTYSRTPDSEGLYKLAINLNPGTYDIKAEFMEDAGHSGSSVVNTIVVNETPQPSELHPYITDQGPGQLGQATPYSCGPHSLMQCIYRLNYPNLH